VQGTEVGRRFPVSVKGVAVQAGKVLLLENERGEWELPGGKLELGEDPADCVVREISEESGWKVTAGPLLDCWQYHIGEGRDVVIVTYACQVVSTDPPVVSHEHKRAGLFGAAEIPGLIMPDGYKRSIAAWFDHLNGRAAPLQDLDARALRSVWSAGLACGASGEVRGLPAPRVSRRGRRGGVAASGAARRGPCGGPARVSARGRADSAAARGRAGL
jgi:8-oxo-dGTP pyrophosphatase MutT (NUDIX family)